MSTHRHTVWTAAAMAAAALGATAATPASKPVDAAALRQAYADLEAAARNLPRDQFDPAAVLESVGRDPAALAAWVRDHTALLPYRGALRGARGVLMDRGGNSLDRSLLLASLLQGAGTEVRLANAQLSPEQVAQLAKLAATSADHRKPPATVGPVDGDLQASRDRAARSADQLLKALGPIGVAPAVAGASPLADHWWVQTQDDGKWADLDPCGSAGAALAPAARTVPLPASSTEAIPLPDADVQAVDFRVVAEVFVTGHLKTDTLLSTTLRPAELLGRPITFSNSVANLFGKGGAPKSITPETVAAATLKQNVFLPLLLVGDRPVSQASIDVHGKIDRDPQLDPSGRLAGQTNAAAASAFGGLAGGGDEAKAADDGVLTAEWVEYAVRVPGRPARTVRREVFDLVGPAARAAGLKAAPKLADADRLRRGLRLIGQTQVLLQPCDLPPSFIAAQSAAADLADRDQWLAMVAAPQAADRQRASASIGRALRQGDVPLTVATARNVLAGSGSSATFIDQPNVICLVRHLDAGPTGSTVTLRSRVDLAITSTAAVADDAGAVARVRQGVADTLAELLTLGPTAAPAENTVGLFESAKAPTVVRPADGAAALDRLPMPADAKARAAADLSAGNTLVLASGNGDQRWGWWRVDPATGQTVGVMDNGYNTAMTEEVLTRDCVDFSNQLQAQITPAALRNATRAQLQAWAARAGADAPSFLANLQEMQRASWLINLGKGTIFGI